MPDVNKRLKNPTLSYFMDHPCFSDSVAGSMKLNKTPPSIQERPTQLKKGYLLGKSVVDMLYFEHEQVNTIH